MSMSIEVPLAVPSLMKSSLPTMPLLARKKSRVPICANWVGLEAPLPERLMSLTS